MLNSSVSTEISAMFESMEEESSRGFEKQTEMVKNNSETTKRRSSLDFPNLPAVNTGVRAARSFSEIEEVLKEMHSDDLIETSNDGRFETNIEQIEAQSSIIENGTIIDANDEVGAPSSCSKEILRSYNGVRKDNKEELGRGLEFVDRNLINLNFRVSDTEFKIKECKIVFSRTRDVQDADPDVVVIKKDGIHCHNEQVKKFLIESLYSYRSKLIKELNPEREIEYVSLSSPLPSEPTPKPLTQNRATSPEPSNNSQLTVRELPKSLASKIQYKSKNEDSLPIIQGLKTVPLKIPPSNEIVGYLFVSSKVQSNFLYYHPKEKSLDQVLEVTNSLPTSLATALMNSDALSNYSGFSSAENSVVDSPVKTKSKRSILDEWDERSEVNERQFKRKETVCKCCCGRPKESQLEEESREVKSVVNIMVDCDNCGKTYKNGSNHKCYKRRGNRTEQKVLSCEVCDRTFSRQAHLSNHMRSHKDYLKATVKCDLCNKRFHKKGEYAQHKAEYHPETLKEFPCNECKKIFLSSYKLTKHKRIAHYVDSDQELDVRCINCNGSYNLTYYRTTHQKECTATSPQNNNSRTNGSVKVTMRKPVARRTVPTMRYEENSENSDDYVEEYVLEAFSEKKYQPSDSEQSSSRPKRNRKRRFMNLDAPTSESETEEPPRKIMSYDSEEEYIGQEELTLSDGEDTENMEEGEIKLEILKEDMEDDDKTNVFVEELLGYDMV